MLDRQLVMILVHANRMNMATCLLFTTAVTSTNGSDLALKSDYFYKEESPILEAKVSSL